MVLRNGYLAVAQKLQEAADSLSQNDVRSRLSDAVNDAHRGTGNYGSYIDHIGDDESGDCVYYCNGDLRSAPYEISKVGGKATATLDTENSKNVVPRTTYEEEADDDDQYAGMEEAFKRDKIYTALPLYERFISKKERNSADEGDFAGKGKSFPILKPGDVQAAVHAMGRAGSSNYGMAQLKSNIIRIAKKKGWTSSLPKAWRDGGDADSKEAKVSRGSGAGSLKLIESHDWSKDIALQLIESTATPMRMKVKLIQAGKGSSAFYPAEVLKRDGPNVFTKGTHIYINHATTAEEAARPEGDWHKLAGALDEDASWNESDESLESYALFTSDLAPLIKEKAPFTGMSIRAEGVAESGTKRDGLPVLKSLTRAESVDVVTRAGAGGMILTESAETRQENTEMTEAEVTKLIEKATATATAPFLERAVRGDAVAAATRILESATLPAATKQRIIERATATLPKTAAGELDADKFRAQLLKEAQDEAAYLASVTGAGRVFGLGAAAPAVELSEADREKQRKEAKRQRKEGERLNEAAVDVFADLMGNKEAAKAAVLHRVA